MCDEGYLTKQEVVTRGKKKFLRIAIKYGPDKYGRLNRPVITGIKRVSRPGLRAYVPVSDIPRVQDGFGCAILSTPAGVITDEIARQKKVGGEVLAYIW
jgi:small subunit ribosomal protein S8